MGARSKTLHLDRWRKSAEFREIARKTAKANLAKFRAAPRCGAARKRDGKPCCNPAMKNVRRCRYHGGSTPRGRQFHVVQFAADEAKFNRKLRDRQRYAAKRALRLAAMTPDQRARHEAWHRSHRPGPGAARNADRERTRQNAETRRMLAVAAPQRPTDPESVRIRTALAAAKAGLAALEARNAKPSDDEGIFS
jgi:hypothetical protein